MGISYLSYHETCKHANMQTCKHANMQTLLVSAHQGDDLMLAIIQNS